MIKSMKPRLKIAHLTPSLHAYSETFIRNRRKYFKGEVYHFYDGRVPRSLEGKGNLQTYLRLKEPFLSLSKEYPVLEDLCYFREALLQEEVDVVYAEYGYVAAECLAAVKSLGLTLFVHFLGSDASSRSALAKYGSVYLDVFDYSSKIISVSESIACSLVELGCPREKILVVPSAVDDEFFNITPSFMKKTVLSVGRFTPKKGPQYSILAFNDVLKKHPDAKLRMIGDGELLEVCKNMVDRLGIKQSVEFLGVCDPEQVRKEMEGASVFAQHSIKSDSGDMEGMPTSIVEASAAGLPVVATNHAGIPEVVVHGQTGVLVDEYDVAGMSREISDLLDRLDYAMKLGASGRALALANHRLPKVMENVNQSIFAACLDSKQRKTQDESLHQFLSSATPLKTSFFSFVQTKRSNEVLKRKNQDLKKTLKKIQNDSVFVKNAKNGCWDSKKNDLGSERFDSQKKQNSLLSNLPRPKNR